MLPTLFELVGLAEPENCQGRSLLPLCDGRGRPAPPRDAVFSENIIPEVITAGDARISISRRAKGSRAIRHPDAKMVRTRPLEIQLLSATATPSCTTCKTIPRERHNLAADPAHKPVVDELRSGCCIG